MACPKCGGTSWIEISPGYVECTSMVVLGMQGSGPIEGRCGARYQNGPAVRTPMCVGDRAGGVPCGTYSIGQCTGCHNPVCGDHSSQTARGRLCVACLRDLHQAQAQAQAQAAAARAALEAAWVSAVREAASAAATALGARGERGFVTAQRQAVRSWASGEMKFRRVAQDVGAVWIVCDRTFTYRYHDGYRNTNDTKPYYVGLNSGGLLVDLQHANFFRARTSHFGPEALRMSTPTHEIDLRAAARYIDTPARNEPAAEYEAVQRLLATHLLDDLKRILSGHAAAPLPTYIGMNDLS